MQRFDPLLSVKNESLIIYDELIDLKPYSDTQKIGKNLEYRLIGTIHHNGNLQYGHYYSNIKIENEWCEFNPLASLGEVVSVFTSPYLSVGAPAQGEAKGLMIHLILKLKVLLIGVRMYAFYFTKKSNKIL